MDTFFLIKLEQMKTLYLVRHAKSSWKDLSLDDVDRPLNKRGKRDAPFMGKRMHQMGISPDKLLTSPAKRAMATAKAFAVEVDYPWKEVQIVPSIYEASTRDLLAIIQNLNNEWQEVVLFGHNPTFTFFANFYAQPALDNVPTAAIVALDFDVENWENVNSKNGQIRFFDYPRLYFPKS